MPCVRGKGAGLQHNGPLDPQRALSLVFTLASKEFPRNRRPSGRSPQALPEPPRWDRKRLSSSGGHGPGDARSGARGRPAPTSTTHVRVLPTRENLQRGEAGARAGDLRQEQQDARAVQRAPALPARVQGVEPFERVAELIPESADSRVEESLDERQRGGRAGPPDRGAAHEEPGDGGQRHSRPAQPEEAREHGAGKSTALLASFRGGKDRPGREERRKAAAETRERKQISVKSAPSAAV